MATDTSDQRQKPDTREPSAERKAELEAAYERQQDSDAPYKAVTIKTLGELLWIFQQRHWSGDGMLPDDWSALPDDRQRPNLSGADLRGANLSGAALVQANLSRAYLREANLSGAALVQANLSRAYLGEANLSGAALVQANLGGAVLIQADLSGVDLRLANLSRASLFGAKLSGAFLYEADLTKAKLNNAILDSKTALGDIIWDGINLSQLNWEPVQRLGDDNPEFPDKTARAYRQLATQLRSQGMNEVADRFAYLAQLWQRRIIHQRLRWTNLRSLGPYLGSLLLWAISGYGYRPSRTFVAYLLTVSGFAAAYYVLTHTVETSLAKLSWDEALVLSLTSFHGRGFLPGFLALGDWVARVGALEAVIGLFIELILIATFSRRFLGN